MSPKLGFLGSVLALSVSMGCSAKEKPAAIASDSTCYSTRDGRAVRSSLLRSSDPEGERWVGVTELEGGERVVEDGLIDGSGRLIRAEVGVGVLGAKERTVVSMNARTGRIAIEGPAGHVEWTAPRDMPWIWTSLLRDPTGASIATPLLARVILRATAGDRAVRMIDLVELRTPTVMPDQLVVVNETSKTVIIGNDTFEIEDPGPGRLHLSALEMDLEPVGSLESLGVLAAVSGCTLLRGSLVL